MSRMTYTHSAVGVPQVTVAVPAGFGFTPPFTITRIFGLATTFDITTLIPAVTNTWYVDPVNGNDGTALVNTRANPLLNLSTALAKNPCDQVRIINLAADFIAKTTKSWNNVQPAVSMSVIKEGNFRFMSAKVASATQPTFIVNPSFSNVYKTTIAAASAGAVIDTSISTAPTYVEGGTFPIPNVPNQFSTLPLQASAAAIAALPQGVGGYFHDGTDLHVRTTNDRNLIGDTQLVVTTTGNNGRFGAVTSGLTLYMEGIDFIGGNAPFLALTALTGNTGNLYHKGCTFQGAQSASNGLSVQGKLTVIGYRSGAYYNKADGFNYHSFEADGTTTGSSPSWIEIECASKGNGTTGSAGGSDNASTSHDFAFGVRLNGYYADSDDRVLAETNSAMTWNLGCYVGQAIKTAPGNESIAALISAQVWIDTCRALAGANPRWIAANASVLNYSNSGPVVNAGTAEATGTVAAYAA